MFVLLFLLALCVSAHAETEKVPSAPVQSAPPPAQEPAGLLSGLSLTSQQGPVTITARELEFDYRNRQLTYRGDVTVSQGDLTLQSNSLQLKLDREIPEKVHEIIAEGHVRVTKGDRLATGGRAVFDQDARTVVLSDQATLREGANEVSGERVVVYLDEQRSVVEGGERRVRAVLFPRGSSPGAAEPHEKSKSEADGS